MEKQFETANNQILPSSAKTFLVADEASFVLHTDAAQSLFLGRWNDKPWKNGRLGLVQFAGLMTRIWKAYYRQDDPYAHLYIIKTYEAITATQEKFINYEKTLQHQLDNIRGFSFSLYRHPSPEKLAIRFATRFGYWGAVLVENMDYVNRLLFTFNKRGLTPELDLTTKQLLREVNDVFNIPTHWRPNELTRKDFFENNQKAQEAKKLFGNIPSEVLNKEITLKFLPEPRIL